MTDVCTIGPVSVENAHIFDSNTFNFSNSAEQVVSSGSTITSKGQYSEEYEFEIICTYDEALQLKGVVEMGELIWMNTSDLTDNDYLQHKGWVLLTNLTIELENPTTLVSCQISYVKISDHEAEYLTMDYSRGIYDGNNLTPGYDITTTSYQLQEDGTDATTNWSAIKYYPTTGSGAGTFTWGTDTAEFDMENKSKTDGVWFNTWVMCDTKKFTPPFTIDIVLDRNSLPGAGTYPAALGLMFSPNNIPHGNKEFVNKKLGDYLEFQWNCSTSSTNLHIAEISKGTTYGSARFLRSNINLGTADADIALRIIFYADGKIRVYQDYDTALGSPTQIYYGPSNLINYKGGLYLYLFVKNREGSASFTGSFDNINIYNANAVAFPNVVMTPPDAVLSTAATGTRTVEDGTASYYKNPTTELRYLIDKSKYYQGSVKLLSTNNDDSASRQVFSTGIKLTPATTTLKNGMTRLTFDADQVILSGYSAGAYNEIDRFEFTADIDFIRPLFINSERVVLQINDTKWTMLRSSRVVTVEHPNTDFDYTFRDTYVTGAGVIAPDPAAGADVAMTADTDYWLTTYDAAADTYQLLIGKRDPTTIKSDNIPADTITGLGWYKKADAGEDAADSLIQQWYKQTRTGISLKQII
jgi:hypothetical protein